MDILVVLYMVIAILTYHLTNKHWKAYYRKRFPMIYTESPRHSKRAIQLIVFLDTLVISVYSIFWFVGIPLLLVSIFLSKRKSND